jgi:hypothetical protein
MLVLVSASFFFGLLSKLGTQFCCYSLVQVEIRKVMSTLDGRNQQALLAHPFDNRQLQIKLFR